MNVIIYFHKKYYVKVTGTNNLLSTACEMVPDMPILPESCSFSCVEDILGLFVGQKFTELTNGRCYIRWNGKDWDQIEGEYGSVQLLVERYHRNKLQQPKYEKYDIPVDVIEISVYRQGYLISSMSMYVQLYFDGYNLTKDKYFFPASRKIEMLLKLFDYLGEIAIYDENRTRMLLSTLIHKEHFNRVISYNAVKTLIQ